MNDDLIDMNDYLMLSSILCDVRLYSFVAIILIFLPVQLYFVNSLHSPSSDVSPIFKYNLFVITMSLILFGLMTVLVDVFQRYDINKQAGEQYR